MLILNSHITLLSYFSVKCSRKETLTVLVIVEYNNTCGDLFSSNHMYMYYFLYVTTLHLVQLTCIYKWIFGAKKLPLIDFHEWIDPVIWYKKEANKSLRFKLNIFLVIFFIHV